jgi:hypothetical protein
MLLDEPLLLSAAGEDLFWRARYRDDDSRVWRARADRAEDLLAALEPAKPSSGPIAALQSLRPVQIDVRVEAPDGRAAGRAVTRLLVADGVRVRRWRDGGLNATLLLPAGDEPRATVILDGTAGEHEAVVAGLAGPLLASRGVLVLSVSGGSVEAARERLAAVPGASEAVLLVATDPVAEARAEAAPVAEAGAEAEAEAGAGAEAEAEGASPEPHAGPAPPAGDALVLPPGVGTRGERDGAAAARAAAWDALLDRLGAVSRRSARSG